MAAGESRTSAFAKLEDATRGRFELIREIGRGGMGFVFLARELDLDRSVAIKVLSSNWLTDEAMVERFRREAKTIASLRHSSIVHVHSVGRADDLHYFVMDFIDGVSVGSLLRTQGPLSIAAVLAVLYHVGSALSYAHRPGRGVIHRDVKPGNIMVDTEGHAFVTDFGISKVTESQSGLTLTGLIIGTPEYMSPEQCRGDTVTAASDQYALGSVVYAMLTGAPPFAGPHYRVLMAHTAESPVPVLEQRPDCPPELAMVVERMLAKLPSERWPDIKDALKAAGARPLAGDAPVREELAELVRQTQSMTARPGASRFDGPSDASGVSLVNPTWIRIAAMPQTLETGDVVPLRATTGFADGSEAEAGDVNWESTDPAIVRVDPTTGHLVAVGAGSTIVTASAAGVAKSIAVEVGPARVAKLAVTPAQVELEAGDSCQLSVEPRARRGQILDRPVLWSSSDPHVATVSDTGEVRAHNTGSASILAHCEGVGAATPITVILPAVASVKLMGAPTTVVVGQAAVLRAEPLDGRGRRLDRGVAWSSSNDDVLRVTETGQFEAVAPGQADVIAECDGARSSVGITVEPPPVAGIVVDEVDSIVIGTVTRLRARVFDARGDEVERAVSWRSLDEAILAVDADGFARGIAVGRAAVVALCEEVESRAEIEVLPVPVARIASTPPPSGVVEGDTFHLEAIPQDANEQPLDREVAWTIDDTAVLESLGGGRFRAVGAGSAFVRAEADGVKADVHLEVEAVRVASLVLSEIPSTLQVDDQVELTVLLHDQRGRPIERPVRWTSSDAFCARVTGTGGVIGAAPGTVTITAECEGVSDAAVLTVTSPPWATVVIKAETRPDASADETRLAVPAVDPELLEADGSADDGAEPVVAPPRAILPSRMRRRPLYWAVPVVVVAGAATVWFAVSQQSGGGQPEFPTGVQSVAQPPDAGQAPPVISTLLIVDAAGSPVADSMTLTVGEAITLVASASDADGNPIPVDAAEWNSTDPTRALIDSSGRLVARAAGNLGVSATVGGIVRSIAVTVAPPVRVTDAPAPAPTRQAQQPPPDPVRVPPAVEEPPPADGVLVVIVLPFADIYVDGQRRDTAARTLTISLSPGTHQLRLENPQRVPLDTTITIVSGDTLRLTRPLQARSP